MTPNPHQSPSTTGISMKIAFYMPFKPLGHKNPSGDLIIGTELYQFLGANSEKIRLVSTFRCRWIYLKPYLWPMLVIEILKVIRYCRKMQPNIWVSYHTYYKAPDIIGPLCCWLLNIPYVVFQGIYSTKRRKKIKTMPGFYLNRAALKLTQCVFTNKRRDEKNLRRLLHPCKIMYIPPGIHCGKFRFVKDSRKKLRKRWQVENRVVVITTAMFRPGVKTDGIIKVINSCRDLKEQGSDIFLIFIGDGRNRQMLETLAKEELGESVMFSGRVARNEMRKYYSGADIFAFPGIEESLGMVYLEAQSCGLPVVAFKDWGASEAVVDGQTGLLAYAEKEEQFTINIQRLVADPVLRKKMGKEAVIHVGTNHDLEKNYSLVRQRLQQIVEECG